MLSEVGIAARARSLPQALVNKWPNPKIDPTVQARWFTAACRAAAATHMGGIYFWAIGFGAAELTAHLDLQHQSAWEAGPGFKAAAKCFGQLSHG